MLRETCPVCDNHLFMGYQNWHQFCKNCAYEKSSFSPQINQSIAHTWMNEEARQKAFKARVKNFKKLLKQLLLLKPQGGSLLEIGSSYGEFLKVAKGHFDILGLEPDKSIQSQPLGLPVRTGFFPNALNPDEKFDVIVFNDVIEHIPDIKNTLKTCYRHLNPEGLLLINLPTTTGFFYRLSKFSSCLGIPHFFERLWQKDLPSPHLHYFNFLNLSQVLQDEKFLIQTKGHLATLHLNGLYSRLSHVRKQNHGVCLMLYPLLILSLPLLKIFPKDIIYVIAKREP